MVSWFPGAAGEARRRLGRRHCNRAVEDDGNELGRRAPTLTRNRPERGVNCGDNGALPGARFVASR